MSVAKREAKSYTRITLALDIFGKLTSGAWKGYHELGIVKHQISLFDEIRISESNETAVVCRDPAVPSDQRNIGGTAVELVRQRFGIRQSVRVDINKNIPVEGGLAGGSTNAATVLMLLNDMWSLGLNANQLVDLGRTIGMDVPFYFFGKTAFDSEAGGVLQSIQTGLRFHFVLVQPPFGVSTKAAYGNLDYAHVAEKSSETACLRTALFENDSENALRCMHNDFEHSVFPAFPELVKIRDQLLEVGCVASFLSGSGSTMVGIAGEPELAVWIAGRMPYRTICSETL